MRCDLRTQKRQRYGTYGESQRDATIHSAAARVVHQADEYVWRDHHHRRALRVLLVQPEKDAENGDRDETPTDAEKPADGAENGTEDEPEENMREVDHLARSLRRNVFLPNRKIGHAAKHPDSEDDPHAGGPPGDESKQQRTRARDERSFESAGLPEKSVGRADGESNDRRVSRA